LEVLDVGICIVGVCRYGDFGDGLMLGTGA
jgi:hypothetical protein